MTYVAGSTSNTANPAKDFMELILHPNLLTAGFTYVEEVIASGTSRIYKSAVAANSVGDWYLIVYRSSDTNPALQFCVCEDYDSTGHLAKKWAPFSVTAGNTLPADRSHYTTAGVSPSNTITSTWALTISGTAHAYVLSLHTKRVIIASRVASTETVIYAGLYEPTLPAVANHFPLCISAYGTSTNSPNTGYSREPGTGTTVATSSGRGSFTDHKTVFPGYFTTIMTPLTGDVVPLDGYQNKATVARVYMPASQSKVGSRGLAIGVYGADNAFAWGDIANIDWAGTVITATCISSYAGTSDLQRLVDQAF